MATPALLSNPSQPQSKPLPPVTARQMLVPFLLFLATLASTTAVGVRYMYNFQLGHNPLSTDLDLMPYQWVLAHHELWASGLPFSLTLIAILLAHEFGHYFACRRYLVDATLPYLLPAPSLSGSFGAVIKLKGRVKTRSALMVIGASGPIAGFFVALITIAIGISCSTVANTTGTPISQQVEIPFIIRGFYAVLLHLNPAIQPIQTLVPHPILTASWIGLLITALNLIPAGQLDGGHIVYALSRKAHRICSSITIVGMAILGLVGWVGWLLWSVALLTPAMRHPKVLDEQPLNRNHKAMAIACFVILAVSGMPAPFKGFGLIEMLQQFHGFTW